MAYLMLQTLVTVLALLQICSLPVEKSCLILFLLLSPKSQLPTGSSAQTITNSNQKIIREKCLVTSPSNCIKMQQSGKAIKKAVLTIPIPIPKNLTFQRRSENKGRVIGNHLSNENYYGKNTAILKLSLKLNLLKIQILLKRHTFIYSYLFVTTFVERMNRQTQKGFYQVLCSLVSGLLI